MLAAWLKSAAGPTRVEYDHLFEAGSGANTTVYSLTGVNIGSATSHRVVSMVCGNDLSGTNTPASAVTVDGVSSTLLASGTNGTTNVAIFITNSETTATAGTVVTTFPSTQERFTINCFELIGVASITPIDTVTQTESGDPNISTVDGGILLGACFMDGGTYTGTLNRNFDFVEATTIETRRSVNGVKQTTGAGDFTDNASVNWLSTPSNPVYVYVSLR